MGLSATADAGRAVTHGNCRHTQTFNSGSITVEPGHVFRKLSQLSSLCGWFHGHLLHLLPILGLHSGNAGEVCTNEENHQLKIVSLLQELLHGHFSVPDVLQFPLTFSGGNLRPGKVVGLLTAVFFR